MSTTEIDFKNRSSVKALDELFYDTDNGKMTSFRDCDFTGVKFKNVKIKNVDFTGSVFSSTSLDGAIFENCIFASCVFERAKSAFSRFINCVMGE